jgi:hypothetical protein
MLHDVKLRMYDRITKRETIEVVTVDADSGDAAAEAAQALRPGGNVVGVAPRGGLSPVGGTVMEGDDDVPSPDDEDSEPGPSNRELAMMQPVKRGPGRPRKEPQS